MAPPIHGTHEPSTASKADVFLFFMSCLDLRE